MNLHAIAASNERTGCRPSAQTREPERILVPVDGSLASSCAVAHAIDLAAKSHEAEIHLLSVQPAIVEPETAPLMSSHVVRTWRAAAGGHLLRDARLLLDANRVSFESHVAFGQPAEEIVRYARAHRCASIVMGSRGRSVFADLVLGSVAARVVRLAAVPVTLVKHVAAPVGASAEFAMEGSHA